MGLFTFSAAYSQDQSINKFQHKNSFQFELGGHGLVYSINYERLIINANRFKTAAQLGCSYYPPSTGVRDLWIPFGINEIISFGKHHIEAGLGYVLIREAARDQENNPDYWFWTNLYSGRIGYRFQKPDGRLILRAAFTPVIEYDAAFEFHPLGGVAVGYSF
jgi:hypothetical protein